MKQDSEEELAKEVSTETGLRVKKSIFDNEIFDKEFELFIQAPGIDWRKQIGSKDIGATFGLIVENLLKLRICKISMIVD